MDYKIDYLYDNNEKIIITIDKIKYEFIINNQEAIVSFNDNKYILDAVEILRKEKSYIYKFHSKDNSFYQEFDYVYTFKLPIKIIQPSKFFIDKDLLEKIDDKIDKNNVYLPVAIINDEYVLLDGHTLLYSLNQNYVKMVNVYISDYKEYIPDFVYIAKENNIKSIDKLDLVNHDDYNKYWNEFLKQFNIIND